ncbi:hypothetical protein D3C75_992030 [compost metagenome]
MQPAVGIFLLETRNCSAIEPQNGFGPVLVPAHERDDGIQRARQLRVQLIHGEHQVVPGGLCLLSFDDARDTLLMRRKHMVESSGHVFQGYRREINRGVAVLQEGVVHGASPCSGS